MIRLRGVRVRTGRNTNIRGRGRRVVRQRRPAWVARRGRTVTPERRSRWDAATTFGSLTTGIAAVAALLLTYQSLTVTERGQVSDRFGRAVEQLGSDTIDVRLGGIYALERLMRDSSDDQSTVVEVLSAYVRTHAPRTGSPAKRQSGKPPVRLATDVQAALTVLGRRAPSHDRYARVDLANTNLNGADLADAHLESADLEGADLEGADLTDADLARADLNGADLNGADLNGANLFRAHLADADLNHADLADANLNHANLADAHLNWADLSGARLGLADLEGASLSGADLNGAYLSSADLADTYLLHANLRCVRVDERTVLPDGVTLPLPPKGGCRPLRVPRPEHLPGH